MLAALLTVATIGSFVGASTSALQALYLSDDVPFLLTLPIPLRVLFVGKFADSAVGALPACNPLRVSGLVGYGFARTNDDAYFLAAAGVAVTLVIGATAGAIATVSTVTRFVPPRKARGLPLPDRDGDDLRLPARMEIRRAVRQQSAVGQRRRRGTPRCTAS